MRDRSGSRPAMKQGRENPEATADWETEIDDAHAEQEPEDPDVTRDWEEEIRRRAEDDDETKEWEEEMEDDGAE